MKTAFKKNHKINIFAIVIAGVLVILSCNFLAKNRAQDENSQPEVPAQPAAVESNSGSDCIAGIFPGKTSRAEVIAMLAEPIATQQDGGYESLLYASPLRGQYNTIYLLDQVVNRVSIVLAEDNPLSWSAVKAQYGEPAHIAFSNYLQGSRNFAFPEQGFNFIADEELDAVFIQNCFIPMPLDGYLQAYGAFLLKDDPFIK
ncbi:MAG: hypothetical protein MUO77_15940 [Anaerolineales bacterium]|nr:hypothetical protein [Anaerolineales bacterium]